jgi:hypothetical protein
MGAGDDRKATLQNALQAAFRQCETVGSPLSDVQQKIIQQVTQTLLLKAIAPHPESVDPASPTDEVNPLDDLTPDQRQALVDYVAECDRNNQDWKPTLFNDWMEGRDSGSVQFLRDLYGLDWVNGVRPQHLVAYVERPVTVLKVGDRIEVSSRLWEWIPEETDEEPTWVICTIILLYESQEGEIVHLNGMVQFENGLELEIPGLNDWNQSNWRSVRQLEPPLESD